MMPIEKTLYAYSKNSLWFIPTNANLYHYSANNPVKYTDPDGETITRFIDSRIASAIGYLYEHSQTFQNTYKFLASETNQQGKTLFVYVTGDSANYAGNTQSQDSPIIRPTEVQKYTNDRFENDILQSGTEVQAVIINIDLERVYSNNLNLLEVVAEEFVHGAEAARVGSNEWNERAKRENKMPYSERPEEIRAKNIVKTILRELESDENN